MPAKKQSSARYDDDDDDDLQEWDDSIDETEPVDSNPSALRLRDWRDVERYREMKELRDLVDDDSALDEIFAVNEPEPILSRAETVRQNSRKSAGRSRPSSVTPARRNAKKGGSSSGRRRGR